MTPAEVTKFIEELRLTAEDEANDITDIPVDDILNKAADAVADLWKENVSLHASVQPLHEEVSFLQDSLDALEEDMGVLLTALSEHGYTEWVDRKGVVRPIPLAWPLGTDDGGMTYKRKMLSSRKHPPLPQVTYNPESHPLNLDRQEQMESLLAWQHLVKKIPKITDITSA